MTTADDKWLVLKSILQAGGGEPIKDGATLSCMANAPRVPIATITKNDIVGEINAPRTQPRRDRINGIIPTYRSEAHFWEVIPGDVVRDAVMLAKDGDERTKEVAYGLVQVEGGADVSQTVELAGYDLENAREAGPITMPLKLQWIGFKAGDCVTCDADGSGLVGKQLILLKRSLDPATGMVPMTMRTDDPAKHARVFARTGTLPPTVTPDRPTTPGDYSLPPAGTRSAYQIVSRTVAYPVTSDDDSVIVAAFDGTLDDGRIVSFPAGDVPAASGGTFGLFYPVAGGPYFIASSPALGELGSSANVFLGWVSTSTGGTYPTQPTPPPGWGGNGQYVEQNV